MLTAAFLFAVVVLTLRYWVLPHVDEYREQIVDGLSRAIHQRLQIGRIEGDWDGYRPRLILREVSLLDAQGQERLRLEQVDSTLSWLSLFAGELRFNSIELEHLSLEIRRDQSGQLLVAGIPVGQSGGEGGLGDWLLAQHRIVVRDSRLTWVDERLGGAPLELKDVDVQGRAAVLDASLRRAGQATHRSCVPHRYSRRSARTLVRRAIRLVRPGLLRHRLC